MVSAFLNGVADLLFEPDLTEEDARADP